MMLRPAILVLLTIALAATQGPRVSQAVTSPTMEPSCFAWCSGAPSQSGSPRLLAGRQFAAEGAASAIATCADPADAECLGRESSNRWSTTPQPEHYFDTMLSAEDDLGSKVFDVMIQIRDWDIASGPYSCTDLGGQAHGSGRDCSNVEAGSDYTEAISILTVAIIAMLALAVVPFAWVMHRSYRSWRLQRYGAVGKYRPVVR
jgi:hypothetical protein